MLFSALVLAAMTRADAEEVSWELDHVYPSIEAFEEALKLAGEHIDELPACKGTLARGASTLADCVEQRYAVALELSHLNTYASNHSNIDTKDDDWQRRQGSVQLLWSRFGEATSWFDPELLALGPQVEEWLKTEERLAPYAYPLRSSLRRGEHTLTPEGERILALTGDIRSAPGATFGQFRAAELPWPELEIDGKTVTLRPAEYPRYRLHTDRDVRRQVFDTFFGAHGAYEATFGNLLATQLKTHWFEARARGFDSCVERSLHADFVPREVYDTLIAETRANLGTLHRYFALRARMMGVEDLGYHDLYVPLVASDEVYDFERSKELTWKSAKPLGKDYVKALREGLDGGWMDVYPRETKVGGAYMDPGAYGIHPYVLLNHTDDWGSASTLAHEMGHAMHTWLAMAEQPFATADYATFTAEIASTFNEALLLDYVLSRATSDDERLFYLGSALENLRGTYFRQAMFGEFELKMHELVEAGQPVTGPVLTQLYGEVLREYHGHDQGVVTITDADTLEWAYVPHFYYDFYVYQYATSIAAASLLAERVLAKEPGAVEKYLALLQAGGSDDPHELLKRAGVDLSTPEPYRALGARMDKIMDEIEEILDRR